MNERRARGVGVCTLIGISLLALFVPTASRAQSLPSGWTKSNISISGNGLSGSAVFSNNVFSVSGAGAGIIGTTDRFMFVHRKLTGDGVIVARVTGLVGSNQMSAAGVMIRESLSGSSRSVFGRVSKGSGVALMWRSSTAGDTSIGWGDGTAPVWLKIQRQGSTFRTYRSANGVSWTSIGNKTISMASTVYVGLAVSNYNTTKLAIATFSNVKVTATAPSNPPPTVSLTAPANGSSYVAPARITLSATASDVGGSVTRVNFYRGSVLIGSDTSSPFSFVWNNVSAGSYTLTAIARDNGGASTTSAARTVTVTSQIAQNNQAPTVSLATPASGATFTAPASIGLTAAARDSDGAVSRVDFYGGSTLIGTDTTSPYGITWGNVAAGTYSLTAVARDNAGGMTVSGARSVLVVNASLPRKAVFIPSNNHATAVTRYVLEIFPAGSSPSTAAPVATQNLGKPAVVNGQCQADITSTISALAPGSYIATVTAVGNGGTAESAPSGAFTR